MCVVQIICTYLYLSYTYTVCNIIQNMVFAVEDLKTNLMSLAMDVKFDKKKCTL